MSGATTPVLQKERLNSTQSSVKDLQKHEPGPEQISLARRLQFFWFQHSPQSGEQLEKSKKLLHYFYRVVWQGGFLSIVLRRLERAISLSKVAGTRYVSMRTVGLKSLSRPQDELSSPARSPLLIPASGHDQPVDRVKHIAANPSRMPQRFSKFPIFLNLASRKSLVAAPDSQTMAVPLAWAATTLKHPFANLGDALSPIVVSALSGLPVIHQRFDSAAERLASTGTIGHGLKHGTVHFWGTGVDPAKNPVNRELGYYERPPGTAFNVHALRGHFSARTFKAQNIDVPEVYGDPVWFLPSIISPSPEKRYELGVIVHLSELTELTDVATVKAEFLRYQVPDSLATEVRVMSMLTEPTFAALEQRVRDITACKRIVSTSLHGLVIAEAYGIPCAYFQPKGKGAVIIDLEDDKAEVDRRMRDFYSGVGLHKMFVYRHPRGCLTDWETVIRAIDHYWSPIYWSAEAFLESFPLPLAFNPLETIGIGDRTLFKQIRL